MTREEAKNIISQMIKDEEGFLSDNTVEAHKMAIQALSQEPCDDAISRILVRMWNCRGKHTTSIDKVKMEQIIHEELPSVTQKSGEWIMSDDGLYRPICDKCGAHPWKGYIPTVEEATEVFKYCPNCGAKMVEPQESEEV